MNSKIKILFASHSYWTSPYKVGNNYYAELFAKANNRVAYISPFISPFHFIFSKNKKELMERYNLYKNGGEYFFHDNLWAYTPFAMFTSYNLPFLRNKWVYDNFYKFTIPNLINLLRKKGWGSVDVLCIDSPLYGFLLDYIKCKISILRITDNNEAFSEIPSVVSQREKELVLRFDVVISTSRKLYKKTKIVKNENIFYIPNGVNFEKFYNASSDFPEEFRHISEPRIIYIGLIAEWFDLKLLAYLAKSIPNASFIVIGSSKINISSTKKISNIYFLGRKENNKIPRYLKNAQVGIIPFKRTKLVETVNPIKLYEYMACGLPVVSTYWEELKYINSPAYLAEDYEDFMIGIMKALKVKDEDKKEHIKFAKKNSWENGFEKIMKIIDKIK